MGAKSGGFGWKTFLGPRLVIRSFLIDFIGRERSLPRLSELIGNLWAAATFDFAAREPRSKRKSIDDNYRNRNPVSYSFGMVHIVYDVNMMIF